MDYRRFGNTIFARIDRPEEILEQLKIIALKEDIKLAEVNALGAVNRFETGVFDTESKQYTKNTFIGAFEIVSLHGTITVMDGEYYSHLHMSAGDKDGNVFGGHLNNAYVSGTCEMVINISEGIVERKFSKEVGLNLFDFR